MYKIFIVLPINLGAWYNILALGKFPPTQKRTLAYILKA